MNNTDPFLSRKQFDALIFTSPKILKYLIFALIIFPNFRAAAQDGVTIEDHLGQMIEESPVFSKIFTGFALYDPESDRFIYQKDAGKYFTPASNTKLLTYYTALKVLGDSIPALRYTVTGDSLIFWGTGNPMLLHPAFPGDTAILHFLKNRPEQLFFSPHNYEDERFGPGWSWRDYSYTYQVEKSPMPLFGNQVVFRREKVSEGFEVSPAYFANYVVFNPELDNRRPDVRRQEFSNTFEYNARAMTGIPFESSRPYHYEPDVVAGILSDTLNRPVGVLNLRQIPSGNARTINVPIPDTLYRRLLKISDNFIAEQLLLAVSEKLTGTQRSERAIQYALDSLFADAPDKLVWKDGSGLSRYNLFTPRSMVYVLKKLYDLLPQEQIFDVFPAGGRSGTIEQWYGGRSGTPPYVFAKTGTLSNKHCLSGYIRTGGNKLLIFSFMHNNYIDNSDLLKKEMEKVLEWVKSNY